MKLSTHDVTKMGISIALAVAAGYALLHVPNFELITSITFLSGLLLGVVRGVFVGAVSMFFFSLFHPLGVPLIPVLIAQILFMALSGFAGGIWRKWIRTHAFHYLYIAGFALTGFLLTLLYDVGTNVAFALSSGLMSQVLKIIAAGLVFSLLHLGTNTILFATLVPTAVKVMKVDKTQTHIDSRMTI